MNTVIFLTNYKNIIPQRNHEIEGLKTDIIARVLNEKGFEITEMTLSSFVSSLQNNPNYKGVYFYYTSSQYAIYKSFILDILVQITLRGGILIPELRHFLAHENKSFQEYEKVRLGIKSPYGIPVGTYEEGLEVLSQIKYPTVIKKSTGFRSRNVKIAHKFSDAQKVLSKLLDRNFNFDTDSLYYLYRRLKNKKHYPKRFGKVIIQEFIPNLTHDWKMLVLGNKCIGVKRFVRKNDFRASGSKIYDLEAEPETYVLDFALDCKEKLHCPNVSFDIAEQNGKAQLIEYQTMHFAILGGDPDYYFEKVNNQWCKFEIKEDLEHYFGLAIYEYIRTIQ